VDFYKIYIVVSMPLTLFGPCRSKA